ncbi:MAG: hypothetical protein KF789_00815, partial [Bdellovibrionaceae bacterium]|nr:hypothetical protein [Pseudobdellovibrionaceae bacterium]
SSTGFVKRTGAGAYSAISNVNIDTETTGTLPITRGGTGATDAQAAINHLLPAQGSNDGRILQTDGTNVSWVDTPTTGITALTGEVTASGSGSVAATIANNAVTSAKILNGTINAADMDFGGVNSATSSFVLKDSTGKFEDFACATTGHVPTWSATGFVCQAPSITETDPKIGANTLNILSKWNGTRLVASGVYENGGNVGIGTSVPNDRLDVQTNASGASVMRVQNSHTSGWSALDFYSSSGVLSGYIGWGNSTSTAPNVMYVGTEVAQPLNFVTSGVARMSIDPLGNVGIGTVSPGAPLDVNGPIKVNASREMASVAANSTTSYTIPDTGRNIRRITLNGNATIRLPVTTDIGTDQAYTLTVRLTQDATGGRTLTWNGNGNTIRWDGGVAPAHSTTANQTTIYQFFYVGGESVWYGSMVWREN